MMSPMFTARFAKRATLATGALGFAALLAAGTANAGTPDDQYLAALQGEHISFGTTESAIAVGHRVCDAIGQGMAPSDISRHLAAANAGIDAHAGLVITVVAAEAYCPQFVHQMSNGTTIVGPDH